MEYRNETEKKVLEQLQGGRVWNNIKDNLHISLGKSSEQNYAIYNNGNHTGMFIPAFFVNVDEAKEIGWKISGKILNADDPFNVEIEIKKKRKHRTNKVKSK